MNDQKRRACITRSDISRIYNAKPYPDDPFIWWLMQHGTAQLCVKTRQVISDHCSCPSRQTAV
ncbi:hypothetical protein T4D_5466 [Trichinella pseudospiralis]|uniref:Uncharacterized protein n=1 Tax=Trichinella pseudospiralis TaxID=6337 RepID=A0A0V1FLS3_TRIPS|nr:hypothetical protein T4D_5466 [Trichinella pseudospiralis]